MKHTTLAFIVLPGLGIVASCSRDSPVELLLEPPDVPTETAEGKGGRHPQFANDALSIDEMLSDPLFQVLVQSIEDPNLSEPLRAAVDALAKGQPAKAKNQITRARAVADALEDGPPTEALILWSAILLFFEEAELI